MRAAIRQALLVTDEAGYYTDIALTKVPKDDEEARLQREFCAGLPPKSGARLYLLMAINWIATAGVYAYLMHRPVVTVATAVLRHVH